MTVEEHKHCEICGRPIGMDARVCSEACQGRLDEAQRAKKRGMLLFVAVIVAALLLSKLL